MTKLQIILTFLLFTALSTSAQFYQIPAWMQDIQLHGDITALGISDPRMNCDSNAIKQAEIRAKAITAILHQVEISYTSDHFSSETEEHRTYKNEEIVEKLGRFNARLPYHPQDFELIESTSNQNNEKMQLFAWTDSGETKPNVISVFCEMYSKEYEASNTRAYAVAELIDIHITDSTTSGVKKYNYHFEYNGHDYEISAFNNGEKFTPPGYSYSYNKTSDLKNIAEFDASENLKKGLWQAYIRSILQAVSEKSKNYDSKIKNIEDNFSEGREDANTYEASTKQQELSREIVKNNMTFYLHGLEIDQNQLYLNISTPQLDEASPKIFIEGFVTDTVLITPCKRTFWDWLFGRNKCN